jgi:hypothetical protein
MKTAGTHRSLLRLPSSDVIPRGYKRGIHHALNSNDGSRLTTCRDDDRSWRPARRPYIPHGIFIFYLLSFRLAHGADLQVSASLDRNRIALNEQAVLSLSISGGGELPQPQLPGLADFQIANAGRSQNFTWINGKASASVTYNYVLTPLREGRFTIPPVRMSYQGQTLETQALPLEVVKGDAAAIPGTAREEGISRPAAPRGPAAVFITGTADKTSVYVGEPVTFIFRLHHRVPLLSRPSYQPPEITGFWIEDLPPQRTFTTQVQGIPYNVTEVRTALFPSVPGKARIGSAALSVTIENFGTDPFGSDFFAQFFGRGEEKILRTEPIPVYVKALPEPKPVGFKGAVGQYRISAQVDKGTIPVGQPLTLTLALEGRGNIKSLPELALPPLTNFRTFDANAATNINKMNGQVEGSKVFKTVLIPTASGELRIPPVPFVFFDPEARAYRTLQSRAITVRATPGAAGAPWGQAPGSPGGLAPAAGAPGIKLLGEDIRYIRMPGSISPQGEPLYRRGWFRWLHGLLLALLAGAGLFRLYHKLFLSNTALYRFRKALERALAAAEQSSALARHDIKGAAAHLADALQDYLTSKLAVVNRSMALKEILEGLKAKGLHPHTAEKVRNLWETLDLFQFAPAQVRPEEVGQAMRTFSHVVDEVEKEIAWTGK